ncbi:unnamed protein product [Brassica oleracea]
MPYIRAATPDKGEASLLGETNYLCGEREVYKALLRRAERCNSSFGDHSLLMWTTHCWA